MVVGRSRISFITVVATLAALLAIGSQTTAAAVSCGGQPATIVGTEGDDFLRGTDGVDVIAGLGGKDKIYGLDGNDLICGGPGRDRIFGGMGHDKIWGNGGNDRINAHAGKDWVYAGNGQDYVLGRSGDDRIFGDNGHDLLFGNRGNDMVDGGDGTDQLTGDDGNDILRGGDDGDTCAIEDESRSGCELPEIAGDDGYAAEMLGIINAERWELGLPLYARHVDLDGYADDWAAEMATIPLPLNPALHHSPPFSGSDHEFQDIPSSVNWTAAFENVGYAEVLEGEGPVTVMDRLFYSGGGEGFMSSPGHRCNISETAAHEVGLGAYVDSNGDVWVAQVFWGVQSPLADPIATCVGIAAR